MKKSHIITISQFIIIFAGLLIINRIKCNKNEYNIKTDTIRKIIKQTDLKPVKQHIPTKQGIEKIIFKKVLVHDTFFVYIFDTIRIKKIVEQHFTKNTYIDTILNDSTGRIIITDTLYKNKIQHRTSDISLYKKTAIHLPKQNNFYIGVGTMLNPNVNINFIQAGYRHKKHLYQIGYGTNKTIIVNYSYKIK